MVRWVPARADVIGEYADEVLQLFRTGRILVGIDGVDGADRTTFARDLAAAIRDRGVAAAALSLEDFRVRDDERAPDAQPYDVDAFRRLVLTPYRRGEAVPIDHADPFEPGERAVLVVEGAFLHRRDLVGLWHASAWLQVSRAVARQRAADRDGVPVEDPRLGREADAVAHYFRELDPRRIANATFDLADAAHPRRVFSDAC